MELYRVENNNYFLYKMNDTKIIHSPHPILIQKCNLDKNSLIFITSDHGEEFLEHTYLTHSHNLYQETLRIPLIVKLPYSLKNKEVNKYASLVDIMPTILRILDVEAPEQTLGNPLLKKK